jgi:hypothetical protein
VRGEGENLVIPNSPFPIPHSQFPIPYASRFDSHCGYSSRDRVLRTPRIYRLRTLHGRYHPRLLDGGHRRTDRTDSDSRTAPRPRRIWGRALCRLLPFVLRSHRDCNRPSDLVNNPARALCGGSTHKSRIVPTPQNSFRTHSTNDWFAGL